MDKYYTQRLEITQHIRKITGNNQFEVNNLRWGNHNSQVHLSVIKRINETTITNDTVVFVELDIEKQGLVNVYDSHIVESIKRCLTKEKFLHIL